MTEAPGERRPCGGDDETARPHRVGLAAAGLRTPQRVQGLDLLRGVAIALVMLRHALPEPFAGAGVVGVVMFFAISGYLITGVLLAELRATGGVALRSFYRRRAARLVPALVVMVAVFAVVTLSLDPLGDRDELGRTVAVALTYTADLPFHHGSDATYHLWTLAVEEQFYLLWPALLIVAWHRAKIGPVLALAGVMCGLACVATLVWLWPYVDLAYNLPTSWAGCFVIGGAARVLADRTSSRVPVRGTRRGRLLVGLALGTLLVLSVVPLRGHATTYLVGGPVIATATSVLLLAWRSWYVVGPRPLRALVALGTVSYGAYLWNYPLTFWLPQAHGMAAAALTLVVAALSWRFVERPALDRWGRRPADRTRAALVSTP